MEKPKCILETKEYLQPHTFESDREAVLFYAYLEQQKYIEYIEAQLNIHVVSKCALEYDNGKNAGEIAKEYNVAVGEIGCKTCGTVIHGAITSSYCDWCGNNYFD